MNKIYSLQVIDALRSLAATDQEIGVELQDIADEAANYRSYATARFLIGPLAALPPEEALKLVATVRAAQPVMSRSGSLDDDGGKYTIRLVKYYDETLAQERWATDFSTTDGDAGVTDNAERADAEWRYWEIAGPLGVKE